MKVDFWLSFEIFMESTYHPKIPDIMDTKRVSNHFKYHWDFSSKIHYTTCKSFHPHTIFIHYSMGNRVDQTLVRLLCLLISSLMVTGVASSRATILGTGADDKLNHNNQPLRRNLLANGLAETPAMGYVLIFVHM